MDTIKIEKYQKGFEIAIHQLIKKVYDEFVSFDYSEEGNAFFYDWIKPLNIEKRNHNQINLFVAIVDHKIVGMIEIRDNKSISLLFVDKEYQGRGIAKSLLNLSLKTCIKRDSKLDMFYVNASSFSIPIYTKLGFVKTDVIREKFGIKYFSMEMKIKAETTDSFK